MNAEEAIAAIAQNGLLVDCRIQSEHVTYVTDGRKVSASANHKDYQDAQEATLVAISTCLTRLQRSK